MSDSEDLFLNAMGWINERDYAALGEHLAEDAVHHTSSGDVTGRDALVGFYRTLCEDAGWRITPHGSVGAGEWVSVVHRNDFTAGSFEVASAARVVDGRVAELWTLGMPAGVLNPAS